MRIENVVKVGLILAISLCLSPFGYADEPVSSDQPSAPVIQETVPLPVAEQIAVEGQPLTHEQQVALAVQNQEPPGPISPAAPPIPKPAPPPSQPPIIASTGVAPAGAVIVASTVTGIAQPQDPPEDPPAPVPEPKPMPPPGTPPFVPDDVEIMGENEDGTIEVGYTDEEGNRVYEIWCWDDYENWLNQQYGPAEYPPGDYDLPNQGGVIG